MAAPGDPLPTVTELLLARADDANPGLVFEDRQWSWAEHVRECADRAALLRSLRRPGPFHVGVLLDNVPEFSFLLGGAALAGAVLVGLNTSSRGEALVRDIELADCQVVLTDSRYVELLQGLNTGARVLDIDSAAWHVTAYRHQYSPLEAAPATQDDLLMLIFTSGTSGEPKAVRCTHGKVAQPGALLADRFELGRDDTAYVSMPMFHSNAIMAGWAVGLAAGARMALRAPVLGVAVSSPDVRDVRRDLRELRRQTALLHPEHPGAARRRGQPAEGRVRQRGATRATSTAFAERFGCLVVDAYGSTEGGIVVPRPPEHAGRLARPAGRHAGGAGPVDRRGRARRGWSASWSTPPAPACSPATTTTASRTPTACGTACSGAATSCTATSRTSCTSSAGPASGCGWTARTWAPPRSSDPAAPPGRRRGRRVRGPRPGGRRPGHGRTGATGATSTLTSSRSSSTRRPDLGPKQVPRFIRLTARLPSTATYKVLKRTLSAQRWRTPDPVWWRPGKRWSSSR